MAFGRKFHQLIDFNRIPDMRVEPQLDINFDFSINTYSKCRRFLLTSFALVVGSQIHKDHCHLLANHSGHSQLQEFK